MAKFRVALSGDFRRADGTPAYPMFDLAPLTSDPQIELSYVDAIDDVMPAERLEGVDALILLAHRFTAASVPRDGRLALVARFGVGYDSVDVAACTAADIAVAITPDGVRRPVAVSIITFMLALAGKLFVKDRITRAGAWAEKSRHMGTGLTGRTLGQLGIGNIGAETFRLAAPFGMRFIAHDPYADPALAKTLGVELVSMEELFRQSDFLSISVPLSDATRGLVDAQKLAWMKPSAYLINTARGPVVNQKDLHDALVAGRIAGAGIDVFDVEPVPKDEPLLRLDNVIVTPHALCWTDECFAGIGASDVAAVLAIKRGEAPAGLVNREVTARSGFREKLARCRE
jgi:D-3-phosphoglycerate dehydrogenase